jgi:hypothetical protein
MAADDPWRADFLALKDTEPREDGSSGIRDYSAACLAEINRWDECQNEIGAK